MIILNKDRYMIIPTFICSTDENSEYYSLEIKASADKIEVDKIDMGKKEGN